MSSKNHLFLVVNKIERCRWTFLREQRKDDLHPGCVVVIRPSNGKNEFEVHRGALLLSGPGSVSREGGLPRDKVVPITSQEFDILLGTHIIGDSARLELHTSGRLKWACHLKAGDGVQVKLGKENAVGVIRGTATRLLSDTTCHGLQFIVEITEEVFKYYFGDKHEQRMEFLCTKNCAIIVPANRIYPPEQPKTSTTKAAPSIKQAGAVAVEFNVKQSLNKAQKTRKMSLKEALEPIVQQYEVEMEQRVHELEDQVSKKEEMIHQLNEQVLSLEGGLQEKAARIEQQQAENEKLCDELKERQREIDTNKEASEQQLRDQQQQYEQQLRDQQQQHEQALAELRQQNDRILQEQQERHQQEEDRLQQEQEELQRQVAQLQQDLQEMMDQKQQLQARVETACAYMRGDPGMSQVGFDAIELWEVPREDVYISNKILGTGGWGYVAEGTFHGQKVAVKCLHRGILSQFTTNHVRREISIMAQVRHPNLILLIGAVLNADTGPLIITELLDRTLRSVYEEHLLEEHCKLPILRDVAAALNYLHSHRRPIIHRDVSSSNVLLEAVRTVASWKAKLSDFGSANLIRLATTPAEGAVIYSAPEVCTEARNQQTPKVDVYSFGVLLCEINVCRLPPDPREFAAFLASVRDNAEPRLYELAQNCTKHTPEERPSMRGVLTQIGELIPME